jgi:hypothetical protein
VDLGGDHLLGVASVGTGLLATEALDLRDGLGCHDHAAPAAARELEHRPDQRQRRGLAREATDHLGAPADLDERALEGFAVRIRLRC